MKLAALSEQFYSLVAPDIPNEWDVDEVLEPLLDEEESICRIILDHVPVIWPVSHSLCYDFLRLAPGALQSLSIVQLPEWVGITLDMYENDGLRSAQRFMQNDLTEYLSRLKGMGGLRLEKIEKKLLPYIRGIARDTLQITAARETYTDTDTIFIPAELSVFRGEEENFLLYKLILAYQWGYIRCGTFLGKAPAGLPAYSNEENTLWLRNFLNDFPEPSLARDLYHLLEAIRVKHFLTRELPGLMRAAASLPLPDNSGTMATSQPHAFLHQLRQCITGSGTDLEKVLSPHLNRDETAKYLQGKATADDSARNTAILYERLHNQHEEYTPLSPLLFQGRMKLQAVARARCERKAKMEEQLTDMMASYLLNISREKRDALLRDEKEKNDGSALAESDISLIMDSEFINTADREKDAPLLVTINNESLELPEELDAFSREFMDEFGDLPARFISSAAGKAGRGGFSGETEDGDNKEKSLTDTLVFDEWDYRRQGYRKNWCSLHMKELTPIHTSFIRNTLEKYHGLSIRLRHQFEMMRNQERYVKRQREGDDIDFDAVVESLSDTRAGLPPSDRLFIRLKRDERDIAVIFLVDMSNSTAGWVNTALKESLVLMTEALEVLGDRYGIYGFSGMRRSRCELFHVKHIGEPYGEEVKERIAAIAPSEYTRMGPPLRHATETLQKIDAKVRLIITLTDGKPEDYDDYKGQYAIEDTRHALLEAKTAGIHPFCITIDHKAQEYMQHMYGPANYIFVDNIRKLPLRMPEIYRALTS